MLASDSTRLKDEVGKFLRTVYRASRNASAMTNRTAVMMTAVTAPAMILAFSRAVVGCMQPACYLMLNFGPMCGQ
ncbi:hypothetical protein GGD63_001706 [Bradyrhizobium sp. cir1]|nr:hypothetical protein [Bradyrhizobium sp. cir1]